MSTATYNLTHYFPLAPSIWGSVTVTTGDFVWGTSVWGAAKWGQSNSIFTDESAPITPLYVDEVY